MKTRRRRVLAAALLLATVACGGAPTQPEVTALGDGRWAGNGPCLIVGEQCTLTIGCGHGQFPRPMLRADGAFDVDGTYRFEAGPISIDPPPPAHFSGVVSGTALRLTVVQSTGTSLGPYTLQPTSAVTCAVPCLTPVTFGLAARR